MKQHCQAGGYGADLRQMRACQNGELVFGVTVMSANPFKDIPSATQQLLGEVRRHLRLQPLYLRLLSTLCICHSL